MPIVHSRHVRGQTQCEPQANSQTVAPAADLVVNRANSTGRVASVDRAWQQILEGAWELLGVVESAGVRSLVFAPAKKRLGKRVALESRESTALGMAALGTPYREIAVAIGSSTATAARIVKRALSKLGLRDMTDLFRWHGHASQLANVAGEAFSGGTKVAVRRAGRRDP